MDVNAIDVTGADGTTAELERLAAENVKRVVRSSAEAQSPWEIESFLELKTVWHPIGSDRRATLAPRRVHRLPQALADRLRREHPRRERSVARVVDGEVVGEHPP